MSADGRPTVGLEVPLHRSLVEPIMIAGLPRTVALVLWTAIATLAFGARQVWTLPVGIVLHVLAAMVTKSDPYILVIILRALRTQDRLDP